MQTHISILCICLMSGFIPLKTSQVNGNENGVNGNENGTNGIDTFLGNFHFSADNFLEKFGYMKMPTSEGNISHSAESRERAVRLFQEYYGLTVSGIMDKNTIVQMKRPRCGVPDMGKGSPNGPAPFTAPGYKWNKNIISWKTTRYSRKLPSSTQRFAFENSFKKWSDVTPLKFEYTNGDPDIEIYFARGNHGDGVGNSFDGPGRVLAHAYYPTDGGTHFDEDEKWVFRGNANDGIDLEVVAAHEFGHALGLGHSNNPDSLMYPAYRFQSQGWKLHYDDIVGIQSLYGSPSETSTPPMTVQSVRQTPRRRPTTQSMTTHRSVTRRTTQRTSNFPDTTIKPNLPGGTCNLTFDAITLGLNGNTYAFRNMEVYKLGNAGMAPGYPKKSYDVFPKAPQNPSAAFHALNHVYIIKGRRLWRYTNFKLDDQYPKEVRNMPSRQRINFAFTYKNHWGDEQIYLFGDTHFWEFNKYTDDVLPRYKLPISSYWTGVPNSPDAGIQWTDNYIYLFKGSKYIKMDPRKRRVIAGYPKDIAPSWIRGVCNSVPK